MLSLNKQFLFVESEGIPPTFVQPMKIEFSETERVATITCQVHGKPMPQIKWLMANNEIMPAETTEMFYNEQTGEIALRIHTPAINEKICYAIEAENPFGQTVGNAELFVEPEQPTSPDRQIETPSEKSRAPRVTPLEAKIIRSGTTLVFKSRVEGSPEPEIKWLKNGKEVSMDDDDIMIVTENNVSTITIRNMNRKRAGKYEIIAINRAGEARSSGSVVVSDTADSPELRAPRFVTPLQPKTVLENDVVILEATVESYPQSSFNWFVNAAPLKRLPNTRIVDKNNRSVLIIEQFNKANIGLYTCRAENVAGSVTSTASVQIVDETELEEVLELIEPQFMENLKPIQLMDGEELTLSCMVVGNPIPVIKWFRNDTQIIERKGTQMLQETNGNCVLTISEVYPEDAGDYTCYASSKIGEATNTATVTIKGISTYNIIYTKLYAG